MKWFNEKAIKTDKEKEKQDREVNIFSQATSWADDIYTTQLAKTSQYRLAAFLLLLSTISLCLVISVMVPLQKTQLVVVHQSSDGVVWVDPPSTAQVAPSTSQTESELVNYVTNRESYSAFSYDYQYRLINLMSNSDIAKSYRDGQDAENSSSPIALLGDTGTQTAQVEDVIFLDNTDLNNTKTKHPTHHNLAQVNYTLTVHKGGQTTTTPYTALIAWTYRGTPDDPQAKWENWDGFTVTQYSVTKRNTQSNE